MYFRVVSSAICSFSLSIAKEEMRSGKSKREERVPDEQSIKRGIRGDTRMLSFFTSFLPLRLYPLSIHHQLSLVTLLASLLFILSQNAPLCILCFSRLSVALSSLSNCLISPLLTLRRESLFSTALSQFSTLSHSYSLSLLTLFWSHTLSSHRQIASLCVEERGRS